MDPKQLPRLRGSAKQVKWATAIRAGYTAAMVQRERDANEAWVHSRSLSRRDNDEMRRMDELHAWIRSQADASWWIERRGKSFQQFAWDVAQEQKPADLNIWPLD